MNGEGELKIADFVDTIRPLIKAHCLAFEAAARGRHQAQEALELIKAAIMSLPEEASDLLYENPFTVLGDDGAVWLVEWTEGKVDTQVIIKPLSTFIDLACDAQEGGADAG